MQITLLLLSGFLFLRAVRDGDHPEDLGDLPQETVI